MRNNLPVTDNEYVMRDRAMLVSKTDLKGRITYCNREFIEASGFSERELIGEPHNLVRHPDMPPEAFADLWHTLKTGKPWTGIVKNRRKNGGYYWVEANVTQLIENGQTVGYMSVRSKPTAAQVEAATRLYREMREGHSHLRLEDGKLVASGIIPAIFRRIVDMSIQSRLIGLVLLLSLFLVGLGTYSLYGLSEIHNTATENLKSISTQASAIDSARLAQVNFKKQVQEWKNILLRGQDAAAFDKYLKQFDQEGQQVTENLNNLKPLMVQMELPTDTVETALKSHAGLMNNYHEALKSFDAAKKESAAVVDKLVKGVDRAPTDQIDGIVKLIQERTQQRLTEAEKLAEEKVHHQKQVSIGIIAFVLLLALAWSILIIRSIVKPIAAATRLLDQIAQGNYHVRFEAMAQNEIGHMVNAMKSMTIKLGYDLAETRRIADENLRIRIGLDNVSTNVMIADTDRHIIYMNKSIGEMLTKAEADIQTVLPHFKVAELMDNSIDSFHRDPSHQKNLLATFTSTHRTEIVLGGRTFRFAANPVISEDGARLGSVIEWLDRTDEVRIEKEINQIVQAAQIGVLAERIDLADKEGFMKQLSAGINQLLNTVAGAVDDLERVLTALAKGDLTQTIAQDYQGTFGQLKDSANATVDNLRTLIGQTKEAVDGITTASREIAMGNSDLSQRTEEQASSLEETASSMEQLTSTVKANAENAKQANQLALGASAVAGKGGAVVTQVVSTMSSINESSRKIVDIISVIDGIAFQTNILALNAAVEAARAGEQGRGFAVVAAEVRNLAQRSAAAAKEIKTLIGDSVEKVENGSKLVGQAGQTMEEIVTSIKRVTDIMSEISAASLEQSSGIEQVNQAITQMDEVTQQNAALVEQAAAAAESLEEQAQNLSTSVSIFKLDDNKNARVRRAPAKTAAIARPPLAKPAAKPAQAATDDGEWAEF